MTSLYARLAELVRAQRPFALATVVRTQGSTPQVVGAKMVVVDDERGRAAGTLGGGPPTSGSLENEAWPSCGSSKAASPARSWN